MRALSGLVLGLLWVSVATADFPGVGRAATDAEIRAWDIDVRPDFAGLPPGSGSVADGEALWVAKCASCHGDFGDANHVFTPLIGNTTADDIKTGQVASLRSGGSTRTSFTKIATVSTLWDYIHRAMPWDAPKSLSHDQVFAVLAYLLNLAEIVPADYVLSHQNIAEVQGRMPNRNGMTQDHGLWSVTGKPDTRNKACMNNCAPIATLSSELPAHARNSHGNLADQNRSFGAVRGVVTADAKPAENAAVTVPGSAPVNAVVRSLLAAQGCTGCHGLDKKILGPGFREIAARYASRGDARAYLTEKIAKGGAGVWGAIPMPPQAQLSPSDLDAIAGWLATGATP